MDLTSLILDCWTKPSKENVHTLLNLCKPNPDLFHAAVLGRPPLWRAQREMCQLVVDHEVSAIISGNAVGKTYWCASLALWYLYTRHNSLVVTTSPTHHQLAANLWRNIREAHSRAKIRLGGSISSTPIASPQLLTLDNDWLMVGVSSCATEKLAGYHSSTGNVLVLVDESSGITREIFDALNSLAADKMVFIGNPLRSDGPFYELWAESQKAGSKIGSMKISSFESPDIHLEKSNRGMACKNWLDSSRAIYGEKSPWWASHVMAEFPDASSEQLIFASWLDLCLGEVSDEERIRRARSRGRIRIGVDLALGKSKEGDFTVILVRNDNEILEIQRSKLWSLEETAVRLVEIMRQYGVDPKYVRFDAGGIGNDFANRLLAHGIKGCQEHIGSKSAGPRGRYKNLRTYCGYALRRRLDPNRVQGLTLEGEEPPKAEQFLIRKDFMPLLRRQLQALSIKNTVDADKQVELESREKLKDRLGESPDTADALLITFGHPPGD